MFPGPRPVNRLARITYRFLYLLARCYWFVFRPTERGSYVALWANERLLVIRNSYKRVFTLPSGGIKSGETALAAAVRELREEVGVRLEPEQLSWAGRFVSHQEYKTDESEVFEAFLDQPPPIAVDGREVISAEFMERQRVEALPLGNIVEQYLRQKNQETSAQTRV